MKFLGYFVIGLGCCACLTLIFMIPGAILIGLGCLLVIGSKHVSPAVNRIIAFCAAAPVLLVLAFGFFGFMSHRAISAAEDGRKPEATQLTSTKQDLVQKPSKFKECNYTKAGSSVRQICEEQAASHRTAKNATR